MATALDLLMSTNEDVNLLSEESDICTIDAKTRVIFVPSTIVVGGVQSDKNAERIKFSCPKIVGDNLDLSKFSVRINFENVSSVDFNVSIKDQYICDDVAVDGENVTFSWLIGRNAARYMGTVRFIVCAVKTDSDSNINVEWNTAIAEVPVLEGIEIDQPQIGREEKDVINQLLELTKNTSAEAVQNVNSAKEQAIKNIQSVSQPDTTLTVEGGIAEAKVTGEAIGSLKEDLTNITSQFKQLYDFNQVSKGCYYANGVLSLADGWFHYDLNVTAYKKIYVNVQFENRICAFFKNNTYLMSVDGNGSSVDIIEDADTISIPIHYTELYTFVISDKPVKVKGNYELKLNQKEFFYNSSVLSNYEYIKNTVKNVNIELIGESKAVIKAILGSENYQYCTIDIKSFVLLHGFILLGIKNNIPVFLDIDNSKISQGDFKLDDVTLIDFYNKKVNLFMDNGFILIKDAKSGNEYFNYDLTKLLEPSEINFGLLWLNNTYYFNLHLAEIWLDTLPHKEQEITHWYGKTWYAYGTSLTNTANEGKYAKYVEQFSGMKKVNKGISGGGIVNSGANIKEAIMNTDDGKLTADLITLETGANDTDVVLGSIYDIGNDTYCGALNQCIRYLQANTNAQIVIISSTNARYEVGNPEDKYTPEKTFGTDSHTKYDQWKAIREVCRINGVYYIPMGESAGLGYARMNASNLYNVDQIHHTELGGYNLGKFVWSKLKEIPLWYSKIN